MILCQRETRTNNENLIRSTTFRDVDVSKQLRSFTSIEVQSGKDPRDAFCENEVYML